MTLNVPDIRIANILLAKLLPILVTSIQHNPQANIAMTTIISGIEMNPRYDPFSSIQLTGWASEDTSPISNPTQNRENIRARERAMIQNPTQLSRLPEINFNVDDAHRRISQTPFHNNINVTDRARELVRGDPNRIQNESQTSVNGADGVLPLDISNDWFNVPPNYPIRNRHLINISLPIGINTVGSSIRNSMHDIPDLYDNMEPMRGGLIDPRIGQTDSHQVLSTRPIGINTVGSRLGSGSWDIRTEPSNPSYAVSPWLTTSIQPDMIRRPLF